MIVLAPSGPQALLKIDLCGLTDNIATIRGDRPLTQSSPSINGK
jgi:hypothetical protein